MSEPHPKYWQVKAVELEFQLAQQQAQIAGQKKQSLWREIGLDPNKNWVLNDEAQTITEAEQPNGRTSSN